MLVLYKSCSDDSIYYDKMLTFPNDLLTKTDMKVTTLSMMLFPKDMVLTCTQTHVHTQMHTLTNGIIGLHTH